MPKAIHLICRRHDGVNLNGLEALGGNRWRSQYWALSVDDAEAFVGGWLYLHGTKGRPSEFGGLIHAVEPVKHPGYAREDGYEVVFEARKEGRHQAWRGASYGIAWTGGPVDLTYPHEGVGMNPMPPHPASEVQARPRRFVAASATTK